MKKLSFSKGLMVLSAAACIAVPSVRATTLSLTVDPNFPPGTTAYVLGSVNPGVPADPADDVSYVNGILGLGLGGSTVIGSDNVYRSMNTFSGLPTSAVVTGQYSGSSSQTSFTYNGGYAFLVAKYDGPNGGTEVWYLGGIAIGTTIDIPANAFGTDNSKYGLSGTVWLDGSSNPPPPPGTPDGGSTMMLLGLAGLGLYGFVRKARLA